MPWITLNGIEMGDAEFIIDHLSKRYNVHFSQNHSQEQNAVARAFRKMAEESLYWLVTAFEIETFSGPRNLFVSIHIYKGHDFAPVCLQS